MVAWQTLNPGNTTRLSLLTKPMNHPRTFFYSCIFFIIGVFIRSVFEIEIFFVYCLLTGGVLLVFLGIFNKYWIILGIWLISLGVGIFRYDLALPKYDQTQIHYYNEQKMEFSGIINKEPDSRQDKVRLEVKVVDGVVNGNLQKLSGKVLVTKFLYPQFEYGDKIRISCYLQQPEQIEDFAYDKYLARYDIYSLCYYPKIELLEKDQGNFMLAGIYDFKNYFVNKLNLILPEPHASFLAGLLLGAKKSIPEDLKEVFNITGTTHIIAVSGYNVTIIAAFLMLVAINIGLSRKKAFWLIILCLIIFAIITGLQASIIRASIMGGLVLLANYLGRLSKVKNILAFVCLAMLMVNPKVLVFDLGFQLSFLATLGLIYLNPVLARFCKSEKLKKYKSIDVIIGDYFLTTMAAIIMTTPLILYQFGKISFVAPLANILILPFIPIAMLLGFIAGLCALLWLKLGWVFGWTVWLVLQYEILILEYLAGFDWAYYEFERIGLGVMVGSYLFLVGVMWWGSKEGSRNLPGK